MNTDPNRLARRLYNVNSIRGSAFMITVVVHLFIHCNDDGDEDNNDDNDDTSMMLIN